MASGKKSFILYADLLHTVEKLPDEKAGQLFKHILEYVNDRNPETDDLILQISFEPIKQQLKRDLKDWENERVNRSLAGKKGMENRWHNKDKSVITEHNSVIKPITNITDTVTVNVTDNVNVTDKSNRVAFAPPTKQDVVQYLVDEKNFDEFTAQGFAEKWWEFYNSKNWMIGKSKMKIWKSAVNTWLQKDKDEKRIDDLRHIPIKERGNVAALRELAAELGINATGK